MRRPSSPFGRLGDDADVRGELEEALDALADEGLVVRGRNGITERPPARGGAHAKAQDLQSLSARQGADRSRSKGAARGS
jgi:hypothetical protein